MQPPPIPHDEAQRLQALWRLGRLDTVPEPDIEMLVHDAATQLDMPIALLSLVDADRQWFLVRVGLDVAEMPRAVSFCGHAICGDDLFVVEDAQRDERFADNPLVTGAPYIRFYAGAPLKSPNGYRVGTLCVIDTQPRGLTPQQRMLLYALADVMAWELSRPSWTSARF